VEGGLLILVTLRVSRKGELGGKIMENPTAYDYMVGLLLVLQDMKEKTNKLEENADRLAENFKILKDAKNILASNLHTQLVSLGSDYHLADLHLGFAENRVASIMEQLKKKELTE